MDLTTLLTNAQSPDHGVRTAAEQALKSAEASNYGMYLFELTKELANETKNPMVRRLAGLVLKNALEGRSLQVAAEKRQKWLAVDPGVSAQIRAGALQVLKSPVEPARRSAAQAVAVMGAIEVERGTWPEFLATLLVNATGTELQDDIKVATLEAIGYFCEIVDRAAVNQDLTNNLLTAIVESMKPARSKALKLAATSAMLNTLGFAEGNFSRKIERNQIMQRICEATTTDVPEVRRRAYECFVRVASLYYEHLKDYMQALYELTFKTIQNDEEEVALQAIEFWSTLCEEEIDLNLEAEDLAMVGKMPERPCVNYIKSCLKDLCNLLLNYTLQKQEEDQDEDSWNIAMSGGTCLGLVAQCVGNDLMPHVMPYVQENIQKPGQENWRCRDAALIAFGAVLEGCTKQALRQIVGQSIHALLAMLDKTKEPSEQVRDTAAWSVGVICDLHCESLSKETFQPLVHALILALDDVPSVARKVAFAIHNLASAFQTQSDLPTNLLSPFLCNSSRNCLRSPRRWVSRLISAATRLRRSTSLSQTARTTCTWLYSSFSALCASASTPPLHFRPTRPRRRTRVTACRRFYAARFS